MDLVVSKTEFARFWGISKGRVSQLLRQGVLKQAKDGRLPARENIEALVLYRNRPRRKSKVFVSGDLEIDLGDILREFNRREAK
jgi:hypothetical protein